MNEDAMYIPFAGLNPIITMKDKKLVVMHGLKRLHNATPRNIVLLGEHTVTKKSWFAVDINQVPKLSNMRVICTNNALPFRHLLNLATKKQVMLQYACDNCKPNGWCS
jgi:hypothetical protein